MDRNLKIVVDSTNKIVEHSPAKTFPANSKRPGQWKSEVNNYLLRVHIKSKRYDASTHHMEVNEMDDDNKQLFYMMTNKGNSPSLIETESTSKGNARKISFPKNAPRLEIAR